MGKIIGTALVWAALPYLFIAALAITYAWPWHVLGIIAALVALFLAGCMFVALNHDAHYARQAREKERRQQQRQLHNAFLPLGPDDVPPPSRSRPVQPKAKPAALPAPRHQWRA